jgi:5'-nucleotidase
MRILVTNDDGISAPGLRVLAAFAAGIGEPLVVAPASEQSACSQSITLRRPFEVRGSDVFADLGIEAYSVDSTPADCVRFAADRFGEFDLVLSGVNSGFNLGRDIAYSGTCSAAFEATYAGIRAMACSTDREKTGIAAGQLPEVWEFIRARRLFDRCSMLNVNMHEDPRGIRVVGQGGTFYRDRFKDMGNGLYKAGLYVAYVREDEPDLSVDTGACMSGYTTVSPLTAVRTDFAALESFAE